MKANIELICIAKVDTFDGQTYEAHVKCQDKEDGLGLVRSLEDRSSISGIEVVGCAFKPVCYHTSEGDTFTKDIFITVKYDDDYVTAMGNIAYEIECLIK